MDAQSDRTVLLVGQRTTNPRAAVGVTQPDYAPTGLHVKQADEVLDTRRSNPCENRDLLKRELPLNHEPLRGGEAVGVEADHVHARRNLPKVQRND